MGSKKYEEPKSLKISSHGNLQPGCACDETELKSINTLTTINAQNQTSTIAKCKPRKSENQNSENRNRVILHFLVAGTPGYGYPMVDATVAEGS